MLKNFFKLIEFIALIVILSTFLAACQVKDISQTTFADGKDDQDEIHSIVFEDSLGNEVRVDKKPKRVVSLLGSFTDVWQLAGGTVIGATNDVRDRDIKVPDDVTIVGSGHNPNLEIILSLKPDFVILSVDYSNHLELARVLRKNDIPTALFKVEFFEDYLKMLRTFTDITEQHQLYIKNGLNVQKRIDAICQKINIDKKPTVLLIRAYSKGVNARTEDDMTGFMLKELNTENIASEGKSLLHDLNMEYIIDKDPDYIFVTVMGSDSQKALARLKKDIQSNPAWKNLSAVKNDRYIVLPKKLFHYKPNSRWDDAYEYLAQILYDE